MSIITSYGFLPAGAGETILKTSVFILTMAMAGLGLNVDLAAFRRMGVKSLGIGIVGSVVLSLVGYFLVSTLHF